MQKVGTKDSLDIGGEGSWFHARMSIIDTQDYFRLSSQICIKNDKDFGIFPLDAVGTKNNNDLQKRSLPTNPRFRFKFAVLLQNTIVTIKVKMATPIIYNWNMICSHQEKSENFVQVMTKSVAIWAGNNLDHLIYRSEPARYFIILSTTSPSVQPCVD